MHREYWKLMLFVLLIRSKEFYRLKRVLKEESYEQKAMFSRNKVIWRRENALSFIFQRIFLPYSCENWFNISLKKQRFSFELTREQSTICNFSLYFLWHKIYTFWCNFFCLCPIHIKKVRYILLTIHSNFICK